MVIRFNERYQSSFMPSYKGVLLEKKDGEYVVAMYYRTERSSLEAADILSERWFTNKNSAVEHYNSVAYNI